MFKKKDEVFEVLNWIYFPNSISRSKKNRISSRNFRLERYLAAGFFSQKICQRPEFITSELTYYL